MPGMVEHAHRGAATQPARAARRSSVVGAMADLVPRARRSPRSRALLRRAVSQHVRRDRDRLAAGSARLHPDRRGADAAAEGAEPVLRVRLVDADDRDVPDGEPGELAMRGPTLFSGYWTRREANARDFRGGWFHMGDVFVRNPDGTLDFVDRRKYLIKSGGENIYPAEIERVMLADAARRRGGRRAPARRALGRGAGRLRRAATMPA